VDVPPDRRRIGMVFQSYALWPHLTVRRNLAYPLKAQRQQDALRGGRVEEVARTVECEGLLDRLPAQLSGGQQQRVALARALVADPQLILFDEPLSNLDARLRDQMRTELHRIHRARPFTAIYVTHDQTEALALGQRIAIMSEGRIEQLGTPEDIFERPASEYVAAFIGMANRIVVEPGTDGPTASGVPLLGAAADRLDRGEQVVLRFGPHDAHLVGGEHAIGPDEVGLPVRVLDAEFGGRHRHVTVMPVSTSAATQVRLSLLRGDRGSLVRSIAVGDELVMAFSPAGVARFPTGAAAVVVPEPVPQGVGGPAWVS
jgi:iron(III) transport system ATP-binding protein